MSIGDVLADAFGGKNEYDARRDKYEVNDNAYEYGGHPGGAAEAANRYANTSNDYNAQARYATDQAYGDRGNAAGARNEQANALSMMRARASGQAPSIAQMQAGRDMQAMQAQQASAAASARGPAALALAQQNAAANTAAGAQGISQNAQIAAAQERLAAEQAYMGGASGMRQQDYAGAQQAAGMSAQFQNTAQGYSQLEKGVQDSALAGRTNREAQKSANSNAVMGAQAGVAGQNAQNNMAWGAGALNMGGQAAGAVASLSDARAKQPLGPGDIVASTWGSGGPNVEAQQSAAQAHENTRAAALQLAKSQAAADGNDDARMTQAGQGRMLGQQVGTSVYEGAPMAGLPSDVRKGMEDTGVRTDKKAKKDEGAKAEAEKKVSPGQLLADKISAGFGRIADNAGGYRAASTYAPPQLVSYSDANAKVPLDTSSPTGTSVLGKGGGMDVMGSLKANSDFGTRFVGNPSGGMMGSLLGKGAANGGMGSGLGGMGKMLSDISGKAPVMMSDITSKGPAMLSDIVGKQFSDARAKQPADGVNPGDLGFYNVHNPNLRWEGDHGALAQQAPEKAMPSLSGPVPKYSVAGAAAGDAGTGDDDGNPGAASQQAKAPPGGSKAKERQMTPDELKAWAQKEESDTRQKTEATKGMRSTRGGSDADAEWARGELDRLNASKGAGPAVDPVADANRAQASMPYAYKPEFTPPEQKPGEVNVGPMAQTMASDPVAATAVKRDPQTGMLMLDGNKMLKLHSAGLSSLQQQQDETRMLLSRVLGKGRR